MSFAEAIVIVVIALYAMIGGAFINAAITAPEQSLRVLKWMWPNVQIYFKFAGAGVMLASVAMIALSIGNSAAIGGLFALGFGNFALFLLFSLSRNIAVAASPPA